MSPGLPSTVPKVDPKPFKSTVMKSLSGNFARSIGDAGVPLDDACARRAFPHSLLLEDGHVRGTVARSEPSQPGVCSSVSRIRRLSRSRRLVDEGSEYLVNEGDRYLEAVEAGLHKKSTDKSL